MDHRPLGIFDSGVGGLTVAKEIYQHLPHESTIYLGDTARVPYGPRSPEAIIRFSREIVRFLIGHNVKAIIVACSTASAHALESLKKTYSVPIYGVIVPATKAAGKITQNHRLAVIGTEATINSHIFSRQLKSTNPKNLVLEQACPLLVPIIEEGILSGPLINQVLKKYLEPVQKFRPDTLILGCTHYPLISHEIAKFMELGTSIINPGETIALFLKNSFPQELRTDWEKIPVHRYYTTDYPESFKKIAKTFLPNHDF